MNVQQKAELLIKRYEEQHGEELPEGQVLFGVFTDGVLIVKIEDGCCFTDVYTDDVYHFDQKIFESGEMEENVKTLYTRWEEDE